MSSAIVPVSYKMIHRNLYIKTALGLVMLSVTYFGYFAGDQPSILIKNSGPSDQRQDPVIILDWTGFMGSKLTENGRDYMAACPELKESCIFTSNRSYSDVAGAVLFHFADSDPEDLPPGRLPWQRYVFFSHESAAYTHIPNELSRDFFNWTMTMSEMSDIAWPYAKFEPVSFQGKLPAGKSVKNVNNKNKNNNNNNSSNVDFNNKTKDIAWFVSNCQTNSGREGFVDELSKHIPVDIFGACGNKTCSRRQSGECQDMVAKEYKFYLAFENSICNGYMTEKFWGFAHKNIVLVVLNRQVMEDAGAPKDSFIAVDEFKDAKALADYLLQISKDEERYLKYFDWRKRFRVVLDDQHPNLGICQLCRKLRQNLPDKTYANVLEWYQKISDCRELHPAS